MAFNVPLSELSARSLRAVPREARPSLLAMWQEGHILQKMSV